MEYHEAANFLFDLRRYPSRTGVEPTRRLLEHVGVADTDIDIVQVGGSNGKGSTARMVESVLREAGYDVGLYTSPHLDDLRERVRVDGRPVSKQAVCDYVEDIKPYVRTEMPDGAPPTFFEAMTGLAARTFERAGVDIAVLEVGIGGEHDATSAFAPDAAAVTNVTFEHSDLLGDTIAEIARDKAAIGADAPLVTAAEGEALSVIEDIAASTERVGTDASADVAVRDRGRDDIEQAVVLDGDDWHVETALPLLGAHQARNAGVAAALARTVGNVSTADIERGLRNAHWPGRFEVMNREPLVVLDGAHNPGSCAGVAATLSTFAYDDLHLVFGAMCDKDHRGMVEALPDATVAYTCRPDIQRAETADSLAAVFEAVGGAAAVEPVGAVEDAVERALAAAGSDDAVIVCGSLFAVAAARRRWTRHYVPTRMVDRGAAVETLRRADVPAAEAARTAGNSVSQTVTTRLRPAVAETVVSEFRRLGGSCAVSGVDAGDNDLTEVVLSGTLDQFERLEGALSDHGAGIARLGAALRSTADGESEGNSGYPWDDGTAVMGILNVTPDSFHDGGRYDTTADAVEQAERLVDAGADIIDVGGESTRPGAEPVPVDAEKRRVIPVVESIADSDALVSVDTRKAAVARAALDAGADILNDVSGLEDPDMRLVAADYDVPVVVMHSIHTPVDPAADIEYDDVVADTVAALSERVLLAEKAGLDREQIIIDPGLGFGKSPAESFELLGRLKAFTALGCPVLVGHSRKSMFGLVDRDSADERLSATVAASALAAERGADIVRVHDVAENVAAVKTAAAASDPEAFTE
ncbi:folylpolyglutamate synthase / 7,8-dihydropteroate reductase / dihydropteroate synthase [Natronomonas pharaonis DSM 2160]|uniref:Probable bifunctional folylpolyglutamate synthase/dihydropteroate synthase n=1 Tax=Natronomonas pharaonis (strain ATCC 35678 / DSM 2160 / CIP 103997 / JCM 8858 / NBRC 14720 / NCIMB 2260 / Gabara) TaxID=348780 RepID=A0A1U7EV27_NATPD|nr:dihydropteroate synthase [Natronomonas pharaonis]CAI48830.1 folylpolyglutamate synthase / 7,8-dihydropteroate reductase / dihydropteroate synthase [Natronomonas pharaonis DSM 2160]